MTFYVHTFFMLMLFILMPFYSLMPFILMPFYSYTFYAHAFLFPCLFILTHAFLFPCLFMLTPFICWHQYYFQGPFSSTTSAHSSSLSANKHLLPISFTQDGGACFTNLSYFIYVKAMCLNLYNHQSQLGANRKSRIFRCLMPFRLMSSSSIVTTYFGKLSRMLSYAPNSRSVVSSDANR